MKPNWRNICRMHCQIYTKENTTHLVNNSAESRCEMHLWISHIWPNVKDGQKENLFLSCWCRWISRLLMSSSSETQRCNEVTSSCIMQRAPFRLGCCRPPAASSPPCRQTFHKHKRNHPSVLWWRGKHPRAAGRIFHLHRSDGTKTGETPGCFCLCAVTWLPVLPGNLLFTETTEQNVSRLRGHQLHLCLHPARLKLKPLLAASRTTQTLHLLLFCSSGSAQLTFYFSSTSSQTERFSPETISRSTQNLSTIFDEKTVALYIK